MTWYTRDAVAEFLLSRGGLRPRTVREYKKHLELFTKAFPEMPLDHRQLQAWVNGQTRIGRGGPEKQLQPETVHARFRTIRAMYNTLWDWHDELEHVRNPIRKVKPPKLSPKPMRVWSDKNIYSFFTLDLEKRERALISLLIDCGPRADECAHLTWDGVEPGFVTLEGKTGTRVVPILDTTYRLLMDLKPQNARDDDHVFIGKRGALKYEGIYKLVKHICIKAGITGYRSSPHTFRHTFATKYAGAETCEPKVLQEIMGHRDFKTTLRYINNNRERMARNHAQCTPLKNVAAAAQGNFLEQVDAVREVEEILKSKK
ncbi:MAG: tyrosine-type recombinase/integrase [Dehalococcoidales bacterium]|nr:tyrosine-type recombinase/integrase [Dehalococcoidales bacterium]